MAIISSMTEISLTSALVQHSDATDEHFHTAFTIGQDRAVLVAAITAALAWPCAALYGNDRLISQLLTFATVSALGGLNNPKLVLLTRALSSPGIRPGVSNKMIGLIAAAIIAIVWSSYWALVVGATASQISQVIIK